MKNDILKNIVIAFLLGLAVFIVFRHLAVVREKIILSSTLHQKQAEITGLQQELSRQKEEGRILLQQKSGLKAYAGAAKRRLGRLFSDVILFKGKVQELDGKMIILKTENQELLDEKNRIAQENQDYKAKFSSIPELKKAIREIKIQAHKPKPQIPEKAQEGSVMVEGNRGFLVKDGKPTTPAKIVIEVVPAPAKE